LRNLKKDGDCTNSGVDASGSFESEVGQMKIIYKYRLEHGYNILKLAKGSQLLSVGQQNCDIVLWAIIDVEAQLVGREILVGYTGSVVDKGEYVGTVTIDTLVYHVFDAGERAICRSCAANGVSG
jgi:hypothetical protein